ncbi:hypothetical protein [Mycobacterium botniense]|uniref:PE-PGRS family protein n=1 Tax=Mycobacterium botniense TaxID=84962 RepID=A0A7I9Y2D7_9MYCO|nr:hypothetical protein [Mycobacterium botniense]GFG76236.1 hypothetical protein MBOT_36010 [Mycobacterium botniense]
MTHTSPATAVSDVTDAPRTGTRRRSLMVAGAAITGAGLIASCPLTPGVAGVPYRAIELTSSAVADLGALGSDASTAVQGIVADLAGAGALPGAVSTSYPWVKTPLDVISTSFSNVSETAQRFLADPFPVINQLIANQVAYADTVVTSLAAGGSSLADFVTGSESTDLLPSLTALVEALASGNFSEVGPAFTNIFDGFLINPGEALVNGGVFDIPIDMTYHLYQVVDTLLGPSNAGLLSITGGVLGSFEAGFIQAAEAADIAATAFSAGQPLEALYDAVNIPSSALYGLLNGIDDSVNNIYFAGLLTPADSFSVSGGLLANLVTILPAAIAADLAATPVVNAMSMALDLLAGL